MFSGCFKKLSSTLAWLVAARDSLVCTLKGDHLGAQLDKEIPKEREGTLTIRDDRTGEKYKIPIVHNAVPAIGFRRICVNRSGKTLQEQYQDGLRVIDPGFRNTAVKFSDITYINGNKGVILYRGHQLESLVDKSYEEITHLLIWGFLPSEKQRLDFQHKLAKAMVAPPSLLQLVATFSVKTPPMVMLAAALTAYMADQPDLIPAHAGKNLYNGNPNLVDEQIIRSLAAAAVCVSVVFCHKTGQEFRHPDPDLNYIQNLLHMGKFLDNNPYISAEKATRILSRLWVLYADHEMTNSTSAFLHITSSLADPLSGLATSAFACYGLTHGGAIDAAYKGMRDIGGVENVPKLIERVVNKECRLSGYGHRIYKRVDPRAQYIREMLNELTHDCNIKKMDPLLDIAMEIDRIAGTHEYFTKRNLHANADLFGSFVYTALGIPSEFATPLAATSRIPGIMAHWKEQTQKEPELWRPLQLYTGPK